MNNSLEKLLISEKENFCKWHCKYNKLNEFVVEDSLSERCECGEVVFIEYRETIDKCEYCLIDDFIKELRENSEI